MAKAKIEIREEKKDQFVALGASIAGIFMIIVVVTLLFAETQAGILVPIAWAFAFLGAALGYFASKNK